MEFSGLITDYPVGHALSQTAFGFQLRQEQRLALEPRYQLSVIRMNSTYLESVDKWFPWKGMITMFALVVLVMVNATLGWGAFKWILEAAEVLPSPLSPEVLYANGIGMAVVVACLDWAAIWLLRKESFAYTHYPIRFNRKTRTIHIFRTDGTILSTPWDKVFFTLAKMPPWDEWEVRGHILEADGVTVKETFALSYVGSLDARDAIPGATEFSSGDFVRAHWEFIRRYMEEGPEVVSEQVRFCMPVNGRHEKMRVSIERIFANIAGAPLIFYWMLFPFCVALSFFRMIAMRTSKIPRWPEDVEKSCQIEKDDPYAFEGDSAGERVDLFPGAIKKNGASQTNKTSTV